MIDRVAISAHIAQLRGFAGIRLVPGEYSVPPRVTYDETPLRRIVFNPFKNPAQFAETFLWAILERRIEIRHDDQVVQVWNKCREHDGTFEGLVEQTLAGIAEATGLSS